MWNVDAGPIPGRTRALDYLIAAGAVVVAALAVHLTSGYFLPMPTPGPVSLFFCAVLLSAWRGAGPGAFAFLLSLLSLCFFFHLPAGMFQFAPRDELRIAYFSLVGVGIVLLGAAKTRALMAAWSANADLAQAVLTLRHTNQKLESDGAERERIYEKLYLSQSLLAEGQRITNTGSWLLNVATSKLIWSDEHYRLFGYAPEIGEPTFQMTSERIHAADRRRVGALVREATRTGARFECEYRIVLPDGETRHIQAAGYPACDIRAGRGEYIGISVDITERRKVEQALRESEREVRTLANRGETVREEERKHLARELHDDLAQYLLALRMKIAVLDFEFGQRQPALAPKTAAMIALLDSSIAVVRNTIASLRPAALDMGIVSALEWLVQQFIAQTSIAARLDSGIQTHHIDEALAVAFFRIAQEALRNVAKHAGATRVDICFRSQGGGYLLVVRDNGAGFDATRAKPGSFGLVGVRERALMLGGKVDITTTPGSGTTIRVHIPVHAMARTA
jgi:signal transduction histidine kinase